MELLSLTATHYTSWFPFAVFAWPEQQRFDGWFQFLREFLWSASENREMLPVPSGRFKLPLFHTQRCLSDSKMHSQDKRTSNMQLLKFPGTISVSTFTGGIAFCLLRKADAADWLGMSGSGFFWSISQIFPNFWAVFTFELFLQSASSRRSISISKLLFF